MRDEVRDGRREGVGCCGRRKRHALGGTACRLGARARAERTANMYCMLVTLDVSKLSGWLNAAMFCRVERGAYNAGRGTSWEAGGCRVVAAAQAACTG